MLQTEFQTQFQNADAPQKAQLLIDLFRGRGQGHYDEFVTQYQHAIQAAHFAADTQNPQLIVAALLHDIGHLFEEDASREEDLIHEEVGADFLAEFYPPSVTEPIRLHVPAKRFLCTTQPAYFQELSPASQTSFVLQGGMMNEAEVKAFQQHPYFESALQLRSWDDLAKDTSAQVPDIETYADLLQEVLT